MLKKAKFYVKEAGLRIKYKMTKDCIFCKMVAGEIKVKPVFENDKVLAIFDINPVASTHVLVIPKRHIESVLTVNSKDCDDVIAMFEATQKIAGKLGLEAFRFAFNAGTFQHVPHLHGHIVSGGKVEWNKL